MVGTTVTRPRDRLGRPLAPGDTAAVAGLDPDLTLDDAQAWAMTVEFIDQGLPFHAHEVCEIRWRQCPDATRLTWQALAQWGAALTHEARGYPDRAARVAAKALVTLAAAPSIPGPVDIERVRESCRVLIP
ncbi:MAG: DUF309 domain-containing protein [Actinomycetes bacterium]